MNKMKMTLNHSSGYFPILLAKHCRTIYNDISARLDKLLTVKRSVKELLIKRM